MPGGDEVEESLSNWTSNKVEFKKGLLLEIKDKTPNWQAAERGAGQLQ